MSIISFEGKVAIVTGSTRGIGAAAAWALARNGAKVVISSRKPESCAQMCAEMRAAGHDAFAIPAHVAKDEDCERLIAETIAHFGRLDVVVANAAVNPVFDPLQKLDPAIWDKVLETNLRAPWRLANLALPEIAKSGGGAMVMISSTAGFFGVPRSNVYGISKAGLHQLARQLAVEWGAKNVRVNVVAPGTTKTEMIRSLLEDGDFAESVTSRTPLARIGEPEEVANAIAFLASEAARHITGQVLTVDGGATIMRTGG